MTSLNSNWLPKSLVFHFHKHLSALFTIDELDVDILVWLHCKDGKYSVKSRYVIFKKSKSLVASGPSSSHQINPVVWKGIWNLKVPNKIKIFLWRACLNILRTCDNLLKRRCANNDLCSICGLGCETVEHFLLLCEWTKGIWFAVCFGLKINPFKVTSFDRWLEHMIVELKLY